jgi:hypothetical protein
MVAASRSRSHRQGRNRCTRSSWTAFAWPRELTTTCATADQDRARLDGQISGRPGAKLPVQTLQPVSVTRSLLEKCRSNISTPCRQLTSPTTSSPRQRRPSGAPSRRTDFLAPRALIRCARRWESSRRPQSQLRTPSRPSHQDATERLAAGVDAEVLGRTTARTSIPNAAPLWEISRPRSASRSSTSR